MKAGLKDQISRLRIWAGAQPRSVWAGIGGGLLILCWLAYGPVIGQIRRLTSERAVLKSDLQSGQETLARLRQGETPVLAGVEKAPEIFSRLEALARTYDVRFLEISPGQSRSPGADQPLLLPVEIRLEGNYRSLGEFLGSLKKVDQASVLVRSVRIVRDAQLLPRLRVQVSMELAFSPDGHGS